MKSNIFLKLSRWLVSLTIGPYLTGGTGSKLRFYPPVVPDNNSLQQWASSSWPDYHIWLSQHALTHSKAWWKLRQASCLWQQPPRITIITPVYNTDPAILTECILSVRVQAYPFWELFLIDDGSSHTETLKVLKSGICRDSRIHVILLNESKGISGASNQALSQAKGDYVAYLDHDDRIAPDALFHLASAVAADPELDVIYSDRDMISPEGLRYMHLMKPGWSPETLLSGNYIFHLMCYRRTLLQSLGGLRSDYDGSQDYDLILRVSETNPNVKHIPHVLYHWRQSQTSVAFDPSTKEYAFEAGINALNNALKRRHIDGKAEEIKNLWRGNYRIQLTLPDSQNILVIYVDGNNNYIQTINNTLINSEKSDFIVILDAKLKPIESNTIQNLVAWLQVSPIGITTAKVLNKENKLLHAGLYHRPSGIPLASYQGYPESEPGYMAVTQIVRNISAPHPYCFAFRRSLWNSLEGFKEDYLGSHAAFDFALRSQQAGFRCLYIPDACFQTEESDFLPTQWPKNDVDQFKKNWFQYLKDGDCYYHPKLSTENHNMTLK